MFFDQIGVPGRPVGREAHELVLPAVHLEAAVIRESRIEQRQRVRKSLLMGERDPISPAVSETGRGPLAHAIQRHYRSLLEWRRIESAGRMRFVVRRVNEALLVSIL